MIYLPLAYIGPGAGFAFLGSLLTLLLSLLASLVSLLFWPFRMLWAVVGRGRAPAGGVKRLIFLGLDGFDPELTERLMAEGKLPNLMRLKEQGSYRRLRPLSPAAWTTFATGVNPARVPTVEPFWNILGRNAIGSTILRVPVTFSREGFNGRLLLAAAAQGGFSLFTKRGGNGGFEGGKRYPLIEADGVLAGELVGPGDSVLFRVRDAEGNATIEIAGESHALKPHQYTPWIRLKFGDSHCIVRFLAAKTGQDFSLYATPVQIDPEKPAIRLSQPAYYAAYLAKLLGSYSTSGMADDMSALKQGVIDEEDFLAQAKLVQSEREAMFFSALDHQPSGVVACVFDMPGDMDRIVGKTLDRVDQQTAVFILSDHGVLFSNRKIDAADPGIEDMAPTALRLFGIQPPEWMEGKSVLCGADW